MKFLFGRIENPSDVIESLRGGCDTFFDNDGNAYYYSLEVDGYDAHIEDSIGRHIPIDLDSLLALGKLIKQSRPELKALANASGAI